MKPEENENYRVESIEVIDHKGTLIDSMQVLLRFPNEDLMEGIMEETRKNGFTGAIEFYVWDFKAGYRIRYGFQYIPNNKPGVYIDHDTDKTADGKTIFTSKMTFVFELDSEKQAEIAKKVLEKLHDHVKENQRIVKKMIGLVDIFGEEILNEL